MTGKDKFHKVMKEFSDGVLESHGKKVTDRSQAIAIAYSEARSVDPEFGSNPISFEDIENIIGTYHVTDTEGKSESVYEREIAESTNQDQTLVHNVIDRHNGGWSDEQIWEEIHFNIEKNMKPSELWNSWDENKKSTFLAEFTKFDESNSKKDWDSLDEDIKQEVTAFSLGTSVAKTTQKAKNKLKQGAEKVKEATKKGVNKLKSKTKEIKEEIQEKKEDKIEEKIIEEEKAKEKIKEEKQMEIDQYIKINEPDVFAANEFIDRGKMIPTEKAVRGFRDKRGDKVIIYYNNPVLQSFLDEKGIHYTLFENKSELNDYLAKFIK